jgi:hypothetical protein
MAISPVLLCWYIFFPKFQKYNTLYKYIVNYLKNKTFFINITFRIFFS